MPDGEYHPAPEDSHVEVDSFLASLINLGIPVNILVVDVLFKRISEEAGP